MPFPDAPPGLPAVTEAQMREVDRLMVEEYGIELLQMMEHAGRALARLARDRFLEGALRGRRIAVLAGTGGNGGGGLVAARHLHNAGSLVQVWTTRPGEDYAGVPAHQLAILRTMGVAVFPAAHVEGDLDLVIDALLGYSLSGPPRGAARDLILWANRQPAPVLSLDLPSGVDATTGMAYDPHILAAATVTLALPKTGLLEARTASGEIYVADIGVPPELYARLALPVVHVFSRGDILQL
jgi:NAD(P)H-hydrate epimerase